MFDFRKTNAIAVLFEMRPQFVKDYKSCLRNIKDDVEYMINTGKHIETINVEPIQKRVDIWVEDFNNFLKENLSKEEYSLFEKMNVSYEGWLDYKKLMKKEQMQTIRTRLQNL